MCIRDRFDGDHDRCRSLDERIARKMGFGGCYPVSGQTYSRKVDSRVIGVLAGIAQSAHKFSNDIRLLQHLKEVEEPFEKKQIGSSAMAYKRNPMRSERIDSLATYVMSDMMNPMLVASTQWFERTQMCIRDSFIPWMTWLNCRKLLPEIAGCTTII